MWQKATTCSNMQKGFKSQQHLAAAGFSVLFHIQLYATFTSKIPAMQQQGASQAAREQLMCVFQLASSTFAQKLQLLDKTGLT